MLGNAGRIAVAIGICTVAGTYAAGAESSSAPTRFTPSADTTTVTGCLQKGAKQGEFELTAKDGKKYDAWSKSVSLAGHVGHTVTLTGTTGTSDKMSGMKDSAMAGGMAMEAPLTVTKLTMVSPKCS